MDVHIREAAASDFDGLCTLFDEVDSLHQVNLPHLFQKPPGPVRDRGYVRGLIADEGVGLLVAQVDGELAGLVCVMIREPPDVPLFVPRRYAVVDNLVVTTPLRRRGIGRALMDRAQQWAAEQGADSVELTVWAFNEEALAFYRGLGFDTASRTMAKRLGPPSPP
jgi:ribosomal protein S18 acetylase RimI-like enzyme